MVLPLQAPFRDKLSNQKWVSTYHALNMNISKLSNVIFVASSLFLETIPRL